MKTCLVLTVGPDRIRAEVARRGEAPWCVETACPDLAQLGGAIQALAAEHQLPPTCRRAVILLERPLVQVRRLSNLPPVGRRALARLVVNQATEFFRGCSEVELVVDTAWPRNGRKRDVAVAAAAEATVIDHVLSAVEDAGWVVHDIRPAGLPHSETLSLLPFAVRRQRQTANRAVLWRWTAAALLLWAAVGASYWIDLARDHRIVIAEFERLEPALDDLVSARRDLREAAAVARTVESSLQARGWASSVLAELSRVIPDSAHLLSLAVERGQRGRLVGLAVVPEAVADGVRGAGAFGDVTLETPAAAVGDLPGRQRFVLSFTVEPAR